jgi:hypothetical protein
LPSPFGEFAMMFFLAKSLLHIFISFDRTIEIRRGGTDLAK